MGIGVVGVKGVVGVRGGGHQEWWGSRGGGGQGVGV